MRDPVTVTDPYGLDESASPPVLSPAASASTTSLSSDDSTKGSARNLLAQGRRRSSKVGLINKKASERRKSIISMLGSSQGSLSGSDPSLFQEEVRRRNSSVRSSRSRLRGSPASAPSSVMLDRDKSPSGGSPGASSVSSHHLEASPSPLPLPLSSPLTSTSSLSRIDENGAAAGGSSKSTSKTPRRRGSLGRRARSGSVNSVARSRKDSLLSESLGSMGSMASVSAVGSPKIDNAELIPTEDLEPVSGDVERACQSALASAEASEWESQFLAVEMLRRIVVCSREFVDAPTMTDLVRVIVFCMKNLRSSVSRAALLLLENVFTYHGRLASTHINTVVPELVTKAGERSAFLQAQIRATLGAMVQFGATSRCITALCAEAKHKNKLVRSAVATALSDLASHRGSRVLRAKDVGLFLITVGTLLSDPDSKVRASAKECARTCAEAGGDFESLLSEHVGSGMLSKFRSVLK